SVIAGLVLTPVASVALSLGLPPGQRHLVVGVDSHQLLGLVMAGLVWVVAAGLAEGMALAEENAQFV
ncbi:MAG TPA: DUF2975 domain-containing protein, partial [Alphaproteobacteria bacterium]|nr:DUF2975 domain-containing protein [Alphaproteobacteria bacterium]